MSDPLSAGAMRVLGGIGLPPGSVPDPAGAVQVSPAVAAGPRPGDRLARHGGHPGVPVPENLPDRRSPRERWEAAVAARPLEAPRALPAAFHAMATAITGRARAPLFTTGPATRHALAAAGALGATTGTVVHLPAAPTPGPAVAAVLAHELTHTRSPVRRPRFLLGGMSGLLDDDERSALSAGREQLTRGAGIVDSLPVGGGIGAVGDAARTAARAAVLEAAAGPMGAATGLLNGASGFANNALGAANNAMGAANNAMGAATNAVDSATGAVDAASGAAQSLVSSATGLAGQGAPEAGKIDPDKIVEIVEARLLREIERRGGRWAGVF